MKPNYADAYLNSGNCQVELNNSDTALKFYEKALAINPNDWKIFSGMGHAYFYKNEIDKACESWKKSLELRSPIAQEYIDKNCAKNSAK